MYPHERSLVEEYKNKPFALLGVNSDRDLKKVRKIVKDKKLTWRSFWNGPKGTRGPLAAKWNVRSWPTIYVIDHKGVIRFKNTRGKQLDRALKTLIAEAESDK